MHARNLGSTVEDIKVNGKIKAISFSEGLSRITQSDGSSTTYQEVELLMHEERLTLLQSHYQEYTESVLKRSQF